MGFFGASEAQIQEYADRLLVLAKSNKVNKPEIQALTMWASGQNFKDDDLQKAQAIAIVEYGRYVMKDNLLDDYELSIYSALLDACKNLTGLQIYNTKKFISDLHTIYKIGTTGELPIIPSSELNIMLAKDEVIHFITDASMRKKKRVTKKINYSGPVASIRICKGVRYRIGSISPSYETSEFWEDEDYGKFFITNQRMGFIGSKKSFTMPVKKLLSLSDGEGGLNIFKDGRSTPFTVKFTYYDLALYILSALLNGIERITPITHDGNTEATAIEAPASVPAPSTVAIKPHAKKSASTGCLLPIIGTLILIALLFN